MTVSTSPAASPPAVFTSADAGRAATRWAALALLSIVLLLAFERLRISAAPLLGPLAAGIVLAARGGSMRVPPLAIAFAQAVVGCMIARSVPVSVLGAVGRSWPLFAVSVGSVIVASGLLGWALARWRVLPGTTAVWGSFPGAATAMVLMAGSFGADMRLVALMQYLRVLLVGVVATSVTRAWLPAHVGAPLPLLPPNVPLHAGAFAATLALAVAGAWIARRARIPAGGLLVPMIAGMAFQGMGLLRLELPWWLLFACYALVGWNIGLGFTRDILRHAAALLPRVLAGIAALIAACGLLACALAHFAHVDPLTAYLATSPGGADTVAIIASASPVDVPFVMAMQSARFLVVAFAGPALARFIANLVPGARD